MLHKIIDFCCIRCEYFRKKNYMTVYAKSHIQHENVQSMLVNVALPTYKNKATPHLTFNMKNAQSMYVDVSFPIHEIKEHG